MSDLTDAQVDEFVMPVLMELVQGLVSGCGRQPDQAIDDIRRACDIAAAEHQREVMQTLAAGGDLPD